MLATGKKLLEKAQKKGYAVGAFNSSDLEITQAIIQAASELKAPVIIQTTENALKYGGEELPLIIKSLAKKAKIPVALHLDHGKDLKTIKWCIDNGYTSVMIDGSFLPFEKNIATTKKVVGMAHKKGVSVEAELGQLKKEKELFTNPEQAKEFVRKTGVDYLAVAIGTSHGAYKFKGKPKLDLQRLKKIKEAVKIPLVLHGASAVPESLVKEANRYGAKLKGTKGVPDSQLKKAIKLGICKVNIDTDIRLAFTAGTRKELKKKPEEFDPRTILCEARAEVKKIVEEKIKLLGSEGKE